MNKHLNKMRKVIENMKEKFTSEEEILGKKPNLNPESER